jgi:hypothetical protein
MAKLNDADFGAKLVAAYRAYRDLHEAGALDSDAEHPRDTVNNWISTIRDCKAQDEGGLGPVEIQKRAEDDQQPGSTPVTGAGSPAGNAGPKPAQDGRYTVTSDSRPLFETADGRVLRGNDALEARAKQSNPTRAANMASRIKGFDRLK